MGKLDEVVQLKAENSGAFLAKEEEETLISLEARYRKEILEATNTPKGCEQAMKNYFNEAKPSESST